jgi:hypothetical protein
MHRATTLNELPWQFFGLHDSPIWNGEYPGSVHRIAIML